MTADRYQRGLDTMLEYTPKDNPDVSSHLKIADDLKDVAPDVPRYMVEFAFGDIYAGSSLTKREQALVTISSLIALGTEPQVELHINTGLTVGLTEDEIAGAITHLIPYVGFPRVLNALYILKKVLGQRGIGGAEQPQEA